MLDHKGDVMLGDPFWGQPLALNSKKLTVAHLKRLAEGLHLPTTTVVGEIRQIIEGKVAGEGHDPRNVQVLLQEAEHKRGLCYTMSDVFMDLVP